VAAGPKSGRTSESPRAKPAQASQYAAGPWLALRAMSSTADLCFCHAANLSRAQASHGFSQTRGPISNPSPFTCDSTASIPSIAAGSVVRSPSARQSLQVRTQRSTSPRILPPRFTAGSPAPNCARAFLSARRRPSRSPDA